VDIKTAIVIFNNGAFGGAVKRYANLFIHLNKHYHGKFFLFVNTHLFNQLMEIYPDMETENIRVIDFNANKTKTLEPQNGKNPRYFKDTIPDPYETDRNTRLPRKLYWYYKNKMKQYILFREIEKYRKELGIKVFCGVFSGILPLVFYLGKEKPKASIIFSDMDSWFSEVHSDMEKLWYRKYYSFNYALENSDITDFLSSFIYEGVVRRGVKVKNESVRIAKNSFIDLSKCIPGEKKNFEIAFCSRLEPDKHPMHFLEAAKSILKEYPDIKFHVLGEGSLVKEIRHYIESSKLSKQINFRFHPNPPEIFKETSVIVSLQKNTNYPSQSLLEAMACGNAVIASDVGDTSLLVNKNNGILVKAEAGKIAEAMETLINRKDLTLQMGKKAREDVINNHSIERYVEYFLGLVKDAYNKNFPAV
jgi:glycosyltransferase involved in cell wall biosynthesis